MTGTAGRGLDPEAATQRRRSARRAPVACILGSSAWSCRRCHRGGAQVGAGGGPPTQRHGGPVVCVEHAAFMQTGRERGARRRLRLRTAGPPGRGQAGTRDLLPWPSATTQTASAGCMAVPSPAREARDTALRWAAIIATQACMLKFASTSPTTALRQLVFAGGATHGVHDGRSPGGSRRYSAPRPRWEDYPVLLLRPVPGDMPRPRGSRDATKASLPIRGDVMPV